MNLSAELAVAVDLARQAGRVVMEYYGLKESTIKAGGSPVTAADHAADRLIREGLLAAFPDQVVLSEESLDPPARIGRDRVWIVDPLDGTREFLAANGEFAVMIGLAIHGEARLGVVYLPEDDRLYRAVAGEGAFVEVGQEAPRRLRVSTAASPPRMIASRSHLDALVAAVRTELGANEPTPCGSVGVKCARIAEGLHDLYIHPVGYLQEWDTCAPEVVLREAGGIVRDCRGDALRYNKTVTAEPHGIFARGAGLPAGVEELVHRLYQEKVGSPVDPR